MSKKFIRKDTRVSTVVLSVMLGVATILLSMLGLITGKFIEVSTIGSPIVVLLGAIFLGSIQIRVFSDYKAQKKFLCADGIFSICLTVLIGLAAIIYIGVQDAAFDLRYVIFAFTSIFAVWKICVAAIAFKNKHFNAFVELLLALLWIASGVGIFLTIYVDLFYTGIYLMSISNYVLTLATIFYMLFSYIFKEPDFLITEKALEIQGSEDLTRAERLNRFNARLNNQTVETKPQQNNKSELDLEEKLQKLQNLKEKGFISEEEFESRKKEILDEAL